MSKLICLIMAFWISYALGSEGTIIIFKEFSAQEKLLGIETVIADKDFLMVNSRKLTPQEIMAQADLIKKISEFPRRSQVLACEAGRFEHILKKGKLIKKESGCLGSERYTALKSSFKALAKDPVIENK